MLCASFIFSLQRNRRLMNKPVIYSSWGLKFRGKIEIKLSSTRWNYRLLK